MRVWLDRIGLGDRYGELFERNGIDPEVLPDIQEADLASIGVTLGDRKRILRAVAEEAPSRAGTLARERRQVTLMFCDLVGSTALASRFDPEEMHTILQGFVETCGRSIGKFDGKVVKYLGDGLLACFGHPQAHEDDPRRALLAGLEVIAAVRSLSDGMEQRGRPRLDVRIGVHTGTVVIGGIGGRDRLEPDALIGDAPNIAARLQALAEPNQMLVSDATRQLAAPHFFCSDLGPQSLRGLDAPLRVYAVEHARNDEDEGQNDAHAAPLISRKNELEAILSEWSEARRGGARHVWLEGEPGSGKTRLVQEARMRLAAQSGVVWLNCSQYHRNAAFHPLLQQIAHNCGFLAKDDGAMRLSKLETWVERIGLDPARIAPPIANALGLAVAGMANDPDARRRREDFFDAMLSIGEALVSRGPMLLVIEDAQWSDPSLAEFLSRATNRYAGLPVLFVFTSRTDCTLPFAPPSALKLRLGNLTFKQSVVLARQIAGDGVLSDALLADIAARSDGVPLFVEEITKAMIEEDASAMAKRGPSPHDVAGASAIPRTLHPSLTARLDRLRLAGELIRLAAVFGRTVVEPALFQASRMAPLAFDAAVREAIEARIIVKTREEGEPAFTFRHALIQLAAYQSMVKPHRAALHRRALETLEAAHTGITAAKPELLAIHAQSSGETDRAIALWRQAGQNDLAKSANREAIAHFRSALGLVRDLPGGPERDGEELALLLLIGAAELSVHGFAAKEVEETYQRAFNLCETASDSPDLLTTLWGLWGYYVVGVRLAEAEAIGRDFLRRARSAGSAGPLCEAYYCVGVTNFYLGRLADAELGLARSVAAYSPAERPRYFRHFGIDLGVCATAYRGWVLALMGRPGEAREAARRASLTGEATRHSFSHCFALVFEAQTLLFLRETGAARPIAEQAGGIAKAHGYGQLMAQAEMMLGRCKERSGDPAGLDQITEGFARYRSTGAALASPYALAWIAEGRAAKGDIAGAMQETEETLALTARSNERYYDAELLRLKASFQAEGSGKSVPSSAIDTLAQARDLAKAQGASLLRLRIEVATSRLAPDLTARKKALSEVLDECAYDPRTPDIREGMALMTDETSAQAASASEPTRPCP